MKLITVKEYAEKKGISLPAAYKRVKEGRVAHQIKYNKTLIKYKEN